MRFPEYSSAWAMHPETKDEGSYERAVRKDVSKN